MTKRELRKNEKKKLRYRTDEEYRERMKANARARYYRLKEQRKNNEDPAD